MSNEAVLTEPATTPQSGETSGAGKSIDAELQELGKLAAQVDGFSEPKVEAQAPRKTDGLPSAGQKETAEKATRRTASATDSESEDPITKEIKSLDVGEERQKSRDRLGNLWEQFNQKQKEFAEQRAKLEQEVEQLRAAPPRNAREAYTPDELRQYAKDWENEGRDDLAAEARKKANTIEEDDLRRSRVQADQQAKFESRVRQNWDSLVKENPDLTDKSSDLYQTTMSYMGHQDPMVKDFLNRHPDGLVLANALAKLQLAGESAADVVKENERLKAENQKLKGRMSLGSSNPSAPMGDKKITDMSTAEAESYVRNLAMQADGF